MKKGGPVSKRCQNYYEQTDIQTSSKYIYRILETDSLTS